LNTLPEGQIRKDRHESSTVAKRGTEPRFQAAAMPDPDQRVPRMMTTVTGRTGRA